MERSELSSNPDFIALEELKGKLNVVEVQLDESEFATDAIKNLYKKAKQELQTQIGTSASGTTIQDLYARLGNDALLAQKQVEPLRGIASEEEIAAILEQADADILDASKFFEEHDPVTESAHRFKDMITSIGDSALLSSAEIVTPDIDQPTLVLDADISAPPQEELDSDSYIAAEQEWEEASRQEVLKVTELKLVIMQNVVRIGKEGKTVPFSARTRESQHDYTELRRKALMYMIATSGDLVSAENMWRAISHDGRGLDHNTKSQVRRWFSNLTYRRRPIILYNGRRGSGSRYQVHPSFKLELDLDYVQDSTTTIERLPAQDAPNPEKELYGIDFGDFYITASHLEKFNHILAASGCDQITPEMIDALNEYAPDLVAGSGRRPDVIAYRKAALDRVEEFLADEIRLLHFLDTFGDSNLHQESQPYLFVNFISGLESDQRLLVKRLIRATPKSHAEVQRGRVITNGKGMKAIDENGLEILPLSPPEEPEPSIISQSLRKEEPEPLVDEEASVVSQTKPPAKVKDLGSSTQAETRLNKVEQARAVISQKVSEFTGTWLEAGLDLDKEYSRNQLSKIFNTHLFGEPSLRAFSRRLIHGNGKLAFEEAMQVLVHGDKDTKSHFKRFKRELDGLISQARDAANQAPRRQ